MSDTSENFPKVLVTPPVEKEDPTSSPKKTSLPSNREKFIEQALVDYESALIGYASTILNDIDLSRDVVQDTFTRLCQQDIEKVRDNLKSWLFTVCRNRAFDLLRKDKRKQPLDEVHWQKMVGPDLPPDEESDRQDRMKQVVSCLDRLTSNQREVIILKFQQDLSYREIQSVTGLTTGNIGFLIHTGLKRLREILPGDIRC